MIKFVNQLEFRRNDHEITRESGNSWAFWLEKALHSRDKGRKCVIIVVCQKNITLLSCLSKNEVSSHSKENEEVRNIFLGWSKKYYDPEECPAQAPGSPGGDEVFDRAAAISAAVAFRT